MTGDGVVGAAQLGPADREASFDRLGNEIFDVVVIGGGVVGAGAALDAVTSGLSVALVEAQGHRLRHLVPVLEAVPRRPALPGDVRVRPGPRGAARARTDAHQDLPAPGQAGVVPVPAVQARRRAARTSAPG